jgi:hypothetical protein
VFYLSILNKNKEWPSKCYEYKIEVCFFFFFLPIFYYLFISMHYISILCLFLPLVFITPTGDRHGSIFFFLGVGWVAI